MYRVELASAALRDLERLRGEDLYRVSAALGALGRDPRPKGKHVKAIRGTRIRFLRYRVGALRILYDVRDDVQAVVVHGILRRKDLERWLRNL